MFHPGSEMTWSKSTGERSGSTMGSRGRCGRFFSQETKRGSNVSCVTVPNRKVKHSRHREWVQQGPRREWDQALTPDQVGVITESESIGLITGRGGYLTA